MENLEVIARRGYKEIPRELFSSSTQSLLGLIQSTAETMANTVTNPSISKLQYSASPENMSFSCAKSSIAIDYSIYALVSISILFYSVDLFLNYKRSLFRIYKRIRMKLSLKANENQAEVYRVSNKCLFDKLKDNGCHLDENFLEKLSLSLFEILNKSHDHDSKHKHDKASDDLESETAYATPFEDLNPISTIRPLMNNGTTELVTCLFCGMECKVRGLANHQKRNGQCLSLQKNKNC